MVNIILSTQSTSQNIETYDLAEYNFLQGIAVKISQLENMMISIRDCLDQTSKRILIDAEYDRLDHFLLSKLEQNVLATRDLARLIVTVQARRSDAKEQLEVLAKYDIQVVLVVGNGAYFDNEASKISIVSKIVDLYTAFSNIQYLGINEKLLNKIEAKLGFNISRERVLSLYGEHSLDNASLWVFVYHNSNSQSLKSYIQRRNSKNHLEGAIHQYSISISQISDLKTLNRGVFIYLDVLTKTQFLAILSNKMFT